MGGHYVCYASLDVIGDPEQSWANYKEMTDAGLHPIPTVHDGSSVEWIKKYCDQGVRYIALGGLTGSLGERRYKFLDQAFSVLRAYWPIKVHAFGVGYDVKVLLRYPFYSSDSTSWLRHARFFQPEEKTPYGEMQIRAMKPIERVALGVKPMLEQEKLVTDVWTKRGITWDE